MQLVGWIALCALASIVLRDRLIVLLVLVLVLWASVPSVASSLITGVPRGGPTSFHFATWLILLTFVVQLIHCFPVMIAQVARHIFAYLALSVFLMAAFLTWRLSNSGGGLVLLLSQMAGPVMLFWLTCVAVEKNPDSLRVLRLWLVGLATVQSILALIEWSRGEVLLFREFYATNYWFDEVRFPRWMGTLDHPLTLSLLICIAIPLVAGVGRIWLQMVLLAVLMGGLLATQSRTGLLLGAVGVLYVVLTAPMRIGGRVVAIGLLAGGAAWLASSQLSAGVTERLTDDGGSAGAREAAVNFFLDHLSSFFFSGGGIGSAYGIAEQGGLTTSLESSFLIYAVDLGVVFALIYFGTQIFLVLRCFGRSSIRGLWFAGLVAVIVPHTYNALGAQTFAAVLIWVVIAMCTSMADQRNRRASVGERVVGPSVLTMASRRARHQGHPGRDSTVPANAESNL